MADKFGSFEDIMGMMDEANKKYSPKKQEPTDPIAEVREEIMRIFEQGKAKL